MIFRLGSKATTAISKNVALLAQISKWAKTVERTGQKIGKKADLLKKRLAKNLAVLEQHFVASNGVEGESAGDRLF